jgi:hypothetical protein
MFWKNYENRKTNKGEKRIRRAIYLIPEVCLQKTNQPLSGLQFCRNLAHIFYIVGLINFQNIYCLTQWRRT